MNVKNIKNIFNDKVVTIMAGVISIVFAAALIINITLIYKTTVNKDQVPHIGGIYPLIVLTDSMNPEFNSGDIIICQKVDSELVKVGDVISYFDEKSGKNSIVTHRVVEIVCDDNNLLFKTKGDANDTVDDSLVESKDVIGVYKTKIDYLGHIVLFMQSKMGLIMCVFLPLVLFGLNEILSRKKDINALNKELEQLKALKQ